MSKISKIAILAAFLSTAAIFGFVSRETLWVLIGGNADQGQISFESLKRSDAPNDFLACPRELCVQASADAVAPVYPVQIENLREYAMKAWSQEANLDLVDQTTDGLQVRYVQRTPLMRFPDTISVRFIAVDSGSSTFAFYSRSLIGYSDLGANKARYQRWIKLLSMTISSSRHHDAKNNR